MLPVSRLATIRELCWLVVLFSVPAYSQEVPSYPYVRRNEEVRVSNLPALKSPSKDASDVLLTSLEIIFNDPAICCGRDSALDDRAARADPRSIKDIIAKLQGRHLLTDGRPFVVTVTDLAPSSANPFPIVDVLTKNHALLMMWNSRLYVVYGALFSDMIYNDGSRVTTINKLLLMDVRYSNARRERAFSRTTDDWTKVQGLLMFTVAVQ